ncbi:MAG: hypothetical protein ABI190_02520 [Casimicrobiaceae bacterium]
MRRSRRILAWIAVVLVVLAIAIAGAVAALMHRFYPHPPQAAYPPPTDLATAQRQDLDYFAHYLDLDRAYAPVARDAARALLAQDVVAAATFTPAQFDLAIMRMVALADNGHSQVFRGPLSRLNNRLPCRLYHFADGYHVLRARGACVALLGAKMVAIDAHPVGEIADRMFVYASGPRNHYDQYSSAYFLESPALLHAAGLATDAGAVTLQLAMPDGSSREQAIAAESPDAHAPRVSSDRYLSPLPIEGEAGGWTAALARDAALPIFLRNYDDPFRSEWWPGRGVYYAQFKSNEDEPGFPIGKFVDRVKTEMTADRPRAIIVDLRFDQGGDFTTTASLMKQLTTLSPAVQHVYVLTSAWTFSAGDVSVALAKDHGGANVSILGEPVGDRIRMWAEGSDLTLPNSKLAIGYATGLHDYSKSCAGDDGCFWVMYFYPMHVKSLEPDLRIDYTYADYAALRDPVLERALMLATLASAR